MATDSGLPRTAYTGSCHCGVVKYIVYLELPAKAEGLGADELTKRTGLRIYKCSCNTCQKMGIFHLRLKDAAEDFYLLSPSNPGSAECGMTQYKTSAQRSSWWFCKTCGVRCFTSRGPSEKAEVDVPTSLLKKLDLATDEGDQIVKKTVWKMQSGAFAESRAGGTDYFSVNAVTLDKEQEGLNLAKWHENKWIKYIDSSDEWKVGAPHVGGVY